MAIVLDGTGGITTNSGTLLSTSDATINGLTVGKGGGNQTYATAVGVGALGSNTTGYGTAIGHNAGNANLTGVSFVAVGAFAGQSATAGYFTAVGHGSLSSNTTGTYNTAVGTQDGSGYGAMRFNTTGSNNVGIGTGALAQNTTASNSVAVGYQAAYSSSTYITAIGFQALKSTTGGENTAVGYNAGNTITTGGGNTIIGERSAQATTTGDQNTTLGSYALAVNTTGSYNIAIGRQALAASTTASNNTAIGHQAGMNPTTGAGNTYVGYQSGVNMSTGSKNTILGSFSGNNGGLDIRTASNNIVLSDGDGNPRLYCNSSGRWSMNGGTNNNNALFHVYSATQDPDIQMGSNTVDRDIHLYMVNTTRTSMFAQVSNVVAIVCGGSGGAQLSPGAASWSAYSDSRLKDVTGAYTNALADVVKLEPVKFTWKHDENKTPCVGLIAQSVEKVVPEAIDKTKKFDYKETGDETEYLSVRYTELIPLMVASIQELKTIVDAQAAEIAELKAKVM
jgi:hypothetical protein